LFSDYICKFHVAFQEGKHSALSISELIFSIEDKVRVLKHADEWHPADVSMLPAMALNTTSRNSDALHDYINSQVKLQLSKILSSLCGQDGSNKPLPNLPTLNGFSLLLRICLRLSIGMVKIGVGMLNVAMAVGNGQTPMTLLLMSMGFASNVALVFDPALAMTPPNHPLTLLANYKIALLISVFLMVFPRMLRLL
jgi:hypothetical protein